MPLRALVIGLDALEVSRVDRLLGEGRLPNLERFAGEATRIDVASDGAELHGSIWPTFAGGAGPGWHGIYQWLQWFAEEMRHRRNNHPLLHFDPFWAEIAGAGHPVAALDMPFVPHVDRPNVRTLAAWGLHDEMAAGSRPRSLMRSANRRFGRHPLSIDVLEPIRPQQKLRMARDLARGVAMRARLLRALARGSDLLVATFAEFHKSGHYLMRSEDLGEGVTSDDAYASIVEAFDAELPSLLAAAGDECEVYLFSLHGAREQVPYDQFGPQILQALAGDASVDAETRPDLLRRARGLVPPGLHEPIWRRVPARLRAARQAARDQANIDPGARILPVFHDGHPGFRVNLQGRERPGVVPATEREATLDGLDVFARELVADSGRPAYTALLRPQETYPGPRAHRLPDALLRANFEVTGTAALHGLGGLRLESTRPEARNGVHTGRGFGFVRPGRGRRMLRDAIAAEDFAPTVLGRFDLPRRETMHGTPFVG